MKRAQRHPLGSVLTALTRLARAFRAASSRPTAYYAATFPAVLLPAACGLLLIISQAPQANAAEDYRTELLQRSEQEIAYETSVVKPVKFLLNPQDLELKIVSFLDISPEEQREPDKELVYCLKAEFQDPNGKSVSQTMLWEKTKRSWDRRDDQVLVAFFYMNTDFQPTDGRVSFVSPPELKNGGSLLLSLAEPAGHKAVIEVFRSVEQEVDQDTFHWGGLRPDLRTKLAQKTLYGADQIHPIEKIMALTKQWQQIPAEGRMDLDYTTRPVFNTGLTIIPQGLRPTVGQVVLPGGYYSVTMQGPGALDIGWRLQTAPDGKTAAAGAEIEITLSTIEQPDQVTQIKAEAGSPYRLPLPAAPSLVTLKAVSQPLEFTVQPAAPATWLNAPKPQLDPCFNATSYFLATSLPQEPVTIEIPAHNPRNPFVFRLTARPLLEAKNVQDPEMHALLSYEFIGADSKIIESGTFEPAPQLSRYARFVNPPVDGYAPSTPSFLYLVAPPGAVMAKIYAATPMLTTFFAKAGVKEYEPVMLPENYEQRKDYSFEDAGARRWFYFRPMNFEYLKRDQRVWSLSVPCGLSERSALDPDEVEALLARAQLMATNTLQPEGFQPRYQIFERYKRQVLQALTNVDAGIEEEPDEWGRNVYKRIVPNQPSMITVASGDASIAPLDIHVLYRLNPLDHPALRVLLDGECIADETVIEPQGVITLDDVAQGNHTILIETDRNDELYIEQGATPGATANSADLYRRRSVFMVAPGHDLIVPVDKPDANAVMLDVIAYPAPDKAGERTELTVENLTPFSAVQGSGFKRLTVFPRRFSIRYNAMSDVGERQFSQLSVGQGYYGLAPLFEDAPPGHYRLRLSVAGGGRVYVRCFMLQELPDTPALVGFYRERGDNW